jgi:hypothetical protein
LKVSLCWAFVFAAGVLGTGCATQYQPAGLTGGYEDQRIGRTQFFVSVRGNGYTGEATLIRHFHRRASELCQSIGFVGYTFDAATRTQTSQTPSSYTANTTYHGSSSETTIQEHPGMNITKHAVSGYVTCNAPLAPAQTGGTQAISLPQAQSASLRLEPGLTREQVAQILGLPTNTESQTAGQNTGVPWQALLWNCVWYDGTPNRKMLTLYFSDQRGWRLNSWSWF